MKRKKYILPLTGMVSFITNSSVLESVILKISGEDSAGGGLVSQRLKYL